MVPVTFARSLPSFCFPIVRINLNPASLLQKLLHPSLTLSLINVSFHLFCSLTGHVAGFNITLPSPAVSEMPSKNAPVPGMFMGSLSLPCVLQRRWCLYVTFLRVSTDGPCCVKQVGLRGRCTAASHRSLLPALLPSLFSSSAFQCHRVHPALQFLSLSLLSYRSHFPTVWLFHALLFSPLIHFPFVPLSSTLGVLTAYTPRHLFHLLRRINRLSETV